MLEKIEMLEQSKLFKEWKKANGSSYLVHVFKMFDQANKDEIQVGYYNKDETITTFIVGKEIKKIGNERIFKKPNTKVMELNLAKVKLDIYDALKKAAEFQKKEYPGEEPLKQILILQNIDVGQVYNITFVTKSFKTLNIKIDAKNKKIVRHELMSLMDLKAK